MEVPGGASCQGSFNVQVAGTNPQPTSFSLSNGGSQSVALGTDVLQYLKIQHPTLLILFQVTIYNLPLLAHKKQLIP